MATSKSWLIPIESSCSAVGRRASGHPPVAPARAAAGTRAAPAPGPPRAAAAASGPAARAPRSVAAACRMAGHLVHRRAVLGGLERQVHLDQHIHDPPGAPRPPRPPGGAGPGCRWRESSPPGRRPFSPCSTAGGRSGATQSACRPPASIFCRASCTLFSPKSRCPASYASRTASMGKVLDTATSRTSSGRRPALSAASAMRSRTPARLAAISLTGTQPHPAFMLLFLQLRHHRLGLRRRTGRWARGTGTSRTRRRRRAACLRSAAPCPADSGRRRSSDRP